MSSRDQERKRTRGSAEKCLTTTGCLGLSELKLGVRLAGAVVRMCLRSAATTQLRRRSLRTLLFPIQPNLMAHNSVAAAMHLPALHTNFVRISLRLGLRFLRRVCATVLRLEAKRNVRDFRRLPITSLYRTGNPKRMFELPLETGLVGRQLLRRRVEEHCETLETLGSLLAVVALHVALPTGLSAAAHTTVPRERVGCCRGLLRDRERATHTRSTVQRHAGKAAQQRPYAVAGHEAFGQPRRS